MRHVSIFWIVLHKLLSVLITEFPRQFSNLTYNKKKFKNTSKLRRHNQSILRKKKLKINYYSKSFIDQAQPVPFGGGGQGAVTPAVFIIIIIII